MPEPLSYRDMMQRTADILGVKRPMVGVPLLSPRLSRLWVTLTSGAPRELVSPLLESLICALHDFRPKLPWYLYVATQSLAHLWVMRSFGRHLGRQPSA